VLIQASVAFYNSGTSITRIDIYNYGTTTSYWDEIVFQ
jgi:hypothetical protein